MDREFTLVVRLRFKLDDSLTNFERTDTDIAGAIIENIRRDVRQEGGTYFEASVDYLNSDYTTVVELPADDEEDEDE